LKRARSQSAKLKIPNRSLSQWLALLEQRHPRAIDLGLDRIAGVAAKLQIDKPQTQVITVAGTNGKGSCVATIEALLIASDVRVGTFTSPHLLAYNERIRINGSNAEDEDICRAFALIEAVRGDISLTYFEFSALAALCLFAEIQLDVIVLEVGLGGRLDAVNIIDPDVAVITSIDLDHQDWLGETRSAIALEKAGVARRDTPVVCADPNPPDALLAALDTLGADVILLGRDEFSWQIKSEALTLTCRSQSETLTYQDLAIPQLPLSSAVCAVQAVLALGRPLSAAVLNEVFLSATLLGRFQQSRFQKRQLILDVAHNPAAAALLARRLRESGIESAHCVFAALQDKDVESMLEPLLPIVSHWHVCSLPETKRSFDAGALAELVYNCSQVTATKPQRNRLAKTGLFNPVIQCYDTPELGLSGALEASVPGDIIVVFGSFYTVSAVLKAGVLKAVDVN